MSKKLLKDLHKDIERYLQEDCYCPNEVYSVDGFCYMLVYADSECKLLGKFKSKYDSEDIFLVATTADKDKPILLNIWCNEEKVTGMERYQLTEHNINQMKDFFNGKIEIVTLSEHDELLRQTQEILSLADCIAIS